MPDYEDLHKRRLIHCHKLRKAFYVFEDYEFNGDHLILTQLSCPMCTDTANRPTLCNGLNEWNAS